MHIITVNDYLATRDADWMGPIYKALGLTVRTIKHGLNPVERSVAYRCDITCCTNKEVAFDYLKDRLMLWDRPSRIRLKLERLYDNKSRAHQLLMRGLRDARQGDPGTCRAMVSLEDELVTMYNGSSLGMSKTLCPILLI